MNQRQRPRDVSVDDVSGLRKRLIEECATEAVTRVRDEDVDLPAVQFASQFRNPFESGQIDFDRIRLCSARLQVFDRGIQRPVSRQNEIESVLGALTREREPDAARGPSDDSQAACNCVHDFLAFGRLARVPYWVSTKRTT